MQAEFAFRVSGGQNYDIILQSDALDRQRVLVVPRLRANFSLALPFDSARLPHLTFGLAGSETSERDQALAVQVIVFLALSSEQHPHVLNVRGTEIVLNLVVAVGFLESFNFVLVDDFLDQIFYVDLLT